MKIFDKLIFTSSILLLILYVGFCKLANSDSTNTGKVTRPVKIEKKKEMENNISPHEYIITLSENNESIIKNSFNQFGISLIKHLGNNMFLLKLINDPGIDAIRLQTGNNKSIIAIQPNYKYKAFN